MEFIMSISRYLLFFFHFQVDLVKKAFQAMRFFLVKASNTKLPSKVREFYATSM